MTLGLQPSSHICIQHNSMRQDMTSAILHQNLVIAESGKLSGIWKYANNLAENDVFGLQTT